MQTANEAPSQAPSHLVDRVMALLGAWFVFGAYLVAYSNLRPAGTANPLAPWQQVVADSGWFLVMGFLAAALARRLSRGQTWQKALPPGYLLSLAGCILFAAGAIADTYWSLAFAFGSGLEALLTPTHLAEVAGGALMVTGPLRSALHRGDAVLGLPGAASAGLLLAALTFGTLFANPYVDLWAGPAAEHPVGVAWWVAQNLGVAAILIQASFLTGIMLYLLRSFRVQFGTMTLVTSLDGFMVTVVHLRFSLLPALVATGLAADVLVWRLRPSPARPGRMQIFGALVPAVYVAAYLAALLFRGGTSWPWRLWLGLLLIAPAGGWLLSRLALAPVPIAPRQIAAEADGGSRWPRHYDTEVSPEQVKDALESLHVPAVLAESPLVRLACISQGGDEAGGELRSLLSDIIRELAASRQPRDAEAGQLLLDYYVKRVGSHEVIAERLHLSRPTFYRRLQRGLALVAERVDELSEFAARQA